MTGQPLSVNEVLRFMNHDFLNQLQLIKTNLALENVEEANHVVTNISTKCSQFFQINGLNSEQLVEWLHTCEWRFPSINITMESDISDSSLVEWDVPLRDYLESTLQHVCESIDPMIDQSCTIHVNSSKNNLVIEVELNGKWCSTPFETPIYTTDLVVTHEHYSDILWRYRVIGSKEGK